MAPAIRRSATNCEQVGRLSETCGREARGLGVYAGGLLRVRQHGQKDGETRADRNGPIDPASRREHRG